MKNYFDETNIFEHYEFRLKSNHNIENFNGVRFTLP